MACVNLRERFGGKHQIAHDPAYYAEHGARGRAEEAWLFVIPGRFGEIYPWGADVLAVSTHGRGSRAHQLAALPFVTVVQDADDGFTLTFDVRHFDEVAELAGLRRRRRLSERHLNALQEGGRKTQFGRSDGSQCSPDDRKPVQARLDDSGVESASPKGNGVEKRDARSEGKRHGSLARGLH